ncbi:hypothetical protein [Mastigocoleus sp. MO_188.B34]|uniref:hypothetical protein n=1 Tax=Mastigocoleus sp. MO_188.B34 TaxID=3036635 RepID=UPI0026353726|nr:hypothetical protein [Mastigocoleus sp. MO_188.B34]MDJ0694815.1 hypothetical protein [Mastigocoleus sp. MO_188.B34]
MNPQLMLLIAIQYPEFYILNQEHSKLTKLGKNRELRKIIKPILSLIVLLILPEEADLIFALVKLCLKILQLVKQLNR